MSTTPSVAAEEMGRLLAILEVAAEAACRHAGEHFSPTVLGGLQQTLADLGEQIGSLTDDWQEGAFAQEEINRSRPQPAAPKI